MTLLKDINTFLRKNLDKVAHFGLSLTLFQIMALLITPIPSFIITLAIGLGYEVTGNNDWMDFLADSIGVAIGLILYIAIMKGGL